MDKLWQIKDEHGVNHWTIMKILIPHVRQSPLNAII